MATTFSMRSNPLVHILAFGLLLGLSLLIAKGPPSSGDEARRVIVTRNDLAHLTAGFTRTWNREPTTEELRGKLEKFFREEVLPPSEAGPTSTSYEVRSGAIQGYYW